MQTKMNPSDLSKHKELLYFCLKLIYLIQMEENDADQLKELGEDLFLTDSSQDIWKLN